MAPSYRRAAASGGRTKRRGGCVLAAGLLAAASTAAVPSASAAPGLNLSLGPAPFSPAPNLLARSGAAAKSASRAAQEGARSISRRIGDLRPPPAVVGAGSDDATSGATLVRGGGATTVRRKKRRSNNSGFYYGIREDLMVRPEEFGGSGGGGDAEAAAASPNAARDAAPQGPASNPAGPGQRLMASAPRRPQRRSSYNSRAALSDIMGETLLELREMREEIAALRDEMRIMKRRMRSAVEMDGDEYGEYYDDGEGDEPHGEIPGSDRRRLLAHGGEGKVPPEEHRHGHREEHGIGSVLARRRKAREFDRIGLAVERWAERLLFEEGGEEDGWKEVACNKMVRSKFNGAGTTTCYLKWMKDSRGGGDPGATGVARGGGGSGDNGDDIGGGGRDDREYPCVKVYATIDAPVETVCAYLSDERRLAEYNDLVVANRDLEEISPHSKITWGQTPQILFIKPRDFVTFCHHRWKKDGTQVVVNQAVEHEDAPGVHSEDGGGGGKDDDDGGGRVCRAFALRGANFIGRDPDDPDKTRFAMLSHADPGGGIPQWATKTAINAVAPIEPFKLFHNIERGVKRAMENGELPSTSTPHHRAEMAAAKVQVPGRSSKPAGLSQLGYACFWPNGGGLKEGFLAHEERHPHDDDMYPHEGPPPPPSPPRGEHGHPHPHPHPHPHHQQYGGGGGGARGDPSRYDGRGAERGEYYDPL